MMLQEEREQLQKLLQELIVLKEDLSEIGKKFDQLQKRANEFYMKIDERLDRN